MGEACRALDFPVVSGNVSLYNETRAPDGTSRSILPTPAIGGLGVLDDAAQAVGLALPPDHDLVLLGRTEGALGQSLWLREILGREAGAPPPLDLVAERRTGDFVRGRILAGAVAACHDLSDGGLLVAVAEMAMAGSTGVRLDVPQSGMSPQAYWFGEDQGRYLLAVADGAAAGRGGAAGRDRGPRAGPQRRRRFDFAQWRHDIPGAAEPGPRRLLPGADGRLIQAQESVMPMAAAEIESLIRASLPDAQVTIEDLAGDGDHYACTVISEAFRGRSRVQQHQLVYAALQGHMGGALHALAIQTNAP